ncbi:MAG: ABC transporter permease [Archangium gephyra]|uniref:Transport permease protein n=1 Tax=Archangium gephyra TaxID=48 RepID=A0A2W5TIF3_9BACT|nr:MAG: ABC transporter permease [Archangium gephyra]
MIRNLTELYQYRALLIALSMRELKARYRASVLGFLWTFLNPTLNMLVYVLVFGVLMRSSVPNYPYYLFCGLLPWIYFASSVMGGTTSVSDRRDLLTKVRFPAQVLPATVVLTNLINFMLSVPLLLVLGLFFGVYPSWVILWALPLLVVQTFFTLALAYLFAAFNVAFRDLQHIVGNLVQMAFFLTPVLWDLKSVPALGSMTQAETQQLILNVNPMASLILAWREIFVGQRAPDWQALGVVFAISLVLMFVATAVFERRREEFAELV